MLKLIKQVVKFAAVGSLCFAIDYLLMVALAEVGQLHYLLSCALAFTVSTIVNYILSMRYVFRRKDTMNRGLEFVLFVTMSIIGLLLTEWLMLLAVETLLMHYMLSKVIVTAIVMIYNFITRKLFLEKCSKQKGTPQDEK